MSCEDGVHVWDLADEATWAEAWNSGQCACGRFVGSILAPVDTKPWQDAPEPERWIAHE